MSKSTQKAMATSWEDVDWELLDRLRTRFLTNAAGGDDYWLSERELAHYDLVFAPRIGWKWDAVLREAKLRGWQPPEGNLSLLDWGCGTGIATRRWLAFWDASSLTQIELWDRSALARGFATSKLETYGIPILERKEPKAPASTFVLLISHVLTELADEGPLLACLEKAESVFWVEPGTPEVSRRLIALRERLRSSFEVLAPCPHQGPCGLRDGQRPRDWCHHFAEPPTEVFQSGDWERASRRLGIDRRSLPVSFLVLQRRAHREIAPEQPGARVLGRPRIYKGHAQILVCREEGIEERTLKKKEEPRAFDDLSVPRFTRWE